MTTKGCRACGGSVDSRQGSSRKTVCDCCNQFYGVNVNSWLSTMKRDAYRRADKHSLPADVSLSDLYDILPKDMMCPVMHTKMIVGAEDWKNSPTLDRIDPKLGYVKGNLQIISYIANAMKSSATSEELLKFAKWIKEKC